MTTTLALRLPDEAMRLLRTLAARDGQDVEIWTGTFLRDQVTGHRASSPGQRSRLAAFEPVRTELRRLRALAGNPSIRVIAQRAGQEIGPVSRSSIATVFNGTQACTWPVLEKITAALDGDTGVTRVLWAQWRIATGLGAPAREAAGEGGGSAGE